MVETPSTSGTSDRDHAELLVLGSGPGGYTAAFRAADLGLRVTLVERYASLGGVCLNVGCIPSKAMLHVAQVLREVEVLKKAAVLQGALEVSRSGVRDWAREVVDTLTGGLQQLARQRGVRVVEGQGQFVSPHTLEVSGAHGIRPLHFEQAIIAAGSQAVPLPGFSSEQLGDPRILDATSALQLTTLPNRLLVVGGGIIGLEMATVYAALGSRVTLVELGEQLIADCDRDLVLPLQKHLARQCEAIHLRTAVRALKCTKQGLRVCLDGGADQSTEEYDAMLVAVGRQANGHRIGASNAGVLVDERGFIAVDEARRSNVDHIFAIGDIAGAPMLAHKASHEGKVAAEVAAGLGSRFDKQAIPAVAYTDPELAWAGLNETEAKAQGIAYATGCFPWAASGRSLAMGRKEGLTKLLFDESSGRILGIGAVGSHAGELVAEGVLALEMGCDIEDISLTVHPHPTLSETLAQAAEVCAGTVTDLYLPGRTPRRSRM